MGLNNFIFLVQSYIKMNCKEAVFLMGSSFLFEEEFLDSSS